MAGTLGKQRQNKDFSNLWPEQHKNHLPPKIGVWTSSRFRRFQPRFFPPCLSALPEPPDSDGW